MNPNPRKTLLPVPIEKCPVEWDFRWVGSEAEAEHVLVLEQAREALRQADMRLTESREKAALRRLVMAMTLPGYVSCSDCERIAVDGLNQSAFICGVIIEYAGPEKLALHGLPTGFEMRQYIRRISKPDPDAETKVRIEVLRKGAPFEPSPISRDLWLLVRVPPGFTAGKATAQFAEWAKVNLPADKKFKGGRPELPSLGLQRLAFYRFDQAWEGPRAYAGFAVSVRGGASDVVRPEFTDFGNRMYAPFMNPKANQPKAATWSESISYVDRQLAPIVAELVDAARSLA